MVINLVVSLGLDQMQKYLYSDIKCSLGSIYYLIKKKHFRIL